MIAVFLHRLTSKIQRLGYAKGLARFFAGFFVVEMAIVATLMGMLRVVQDEKRFETAGCRAGSPGQVFARCRPAVFLIHS